MFDWLRRRIRERSLSASEPTSAVEPISPPPPVAAGTSPVATSPPPAAPEPDRRPVSADYPVPLSRPRLPPCQVVIRLGRTGLGALPVSPRTRPRDDVRWVPPGRSITVHGFEIPDGMVYLGKFLTAAPGGGWGADRPAPCLLDPALKVAPGRPSPGADMGYWPSYSDITPEHRRNYLAWLAGGKRDGTYAVGYTFLYFYGLERRLLVDNPGSEEEARLVAEVERLRALYAENRSMAGYAQRLLDVVELRRLSASPGGLATWRPDLASLTRGGGMPLPLQVKIAAHAHHRVPLDFEDAIAAMITLAPFQGGPPYSIGMSRTRREFVELVRRRFQTKFPKGLLLKVTGKEPLMLCYVPASQHLDVEICVEGAERLPDISSNNWSALAGICAKAAEDLGPYAKLVGKDGKGAVSLAAALALPPDVGEIAPVEAFKRWLGELPSPVAEVPVATLRRWCFGDGRDCVGSKPLREISTMLASVGWGMEPDPSHGGEKSGNTLFLFRGGEPPACFPQASLAACLVAGADTDMDPDRVADGIAVQLGLATPAALRLAARCRSISGRPMTPARVKTMLGKIAQHERAATAELAAAAASATGEPSHAVLVALERLYDLCGVDRRGLYATLHRGTAAAAPRAEEPVVVERRTPQGRTFRVPPPPGAAKPRLPQEGVAIDMERVSAILRETREVAEVLAPIYQDDEVPPAAVPPTGPPHAGPTAPSRFAGLGAMQAALLTALYEREIWPRAEFEDLARAHGLMPDGAIEAINDWAFDSCDEALIEDGDPLTINVALLPDAPEEAA